MGIDKKSDNDNPGTLGVATEFGNFHDVFVSISATKLRISFWSGQYLSFRHVCNVSQYSAFSVRTVNLSHVLHGEVCEPLPFFYRLSRPPF